jgi:hypothetical protein
MIAPGIAQITRLRAVSPETPALIAAMYAARRAARHKNTGYAVTAMIATPNPTIAAMNC